MPPPEILDRVVHRDRVPVRIAPVLEEAPQGLRADAAYRDHFVVPGGLALDAVEAQRSAYRQQQQ